MLYEYPWTEDSEIEYVRSVLIYYLRKQILINRDLRLRDELRIEKEILQLNP